MQLNENIKKYRLALGISQVELAKKLGVTKQCLSNWENDNVQPSVEMLIRLSNFFAVSTDALLGLDERTEISLAQLTSEEAAHIRAIVACLAAKKH